MPKRKPTKNDRDYGTYLTWQAMIKYADGKQLTRQEWEDLSWLTLIDRNNLTFEPTNCCWAQSEQERADNLRFYQSLRQPPTH